MDNHLQVHSISPSALMFLEKLTDELFMLFVAGRCFSLFALPCANDSVRSSSDLHDGRSCFYTKPCILC